MKNTFLVIIIIMASFSLTYAQKSEKYTKKDFAYSNHFSLLAGMIQPTALGGGNIEVNYFTKRMVFDYSHGFSLNPPVVGDYKDQNLALHLPYSTGFGIGYRITEFLDVRFEPKLHSWEVYQKGVERTVSNKILDFRTVTLGLGMYYRYMPFKNSDNTFLQGITTSSSIRWWQNASSTIAGNEVTYFNKTTGKNEVFKTPNIGLANSPIVVNIAVGYTFGGK
jgi:hypothetical protein